MQSKIVTDVNEAKPNDLIYDIDLGVDLLKDFLQKTSVHAKDFKKLSKKMDGKNKNKQQKDLNKFCKDKLLNQWNFYFKDKFYTRNELENLSEDIEYTYILGIFISGNSELPNIKNNLNKVLANSIYELTQRASETWKN